MLSTMQRKHKDKGMCAKSAIDATRLRLKIHLNIHDIKKPWKSRAFKTKIQQMARLTARSVTAHQITRFNALAFSVGRLEKRCDARGILGQAFQFTLPLHYLARV